MIIKFLGFTDVLTLYRLGQIFGVFGLTALALQVVMSARIRFIEKKIGYPRLLKLHSLNAKLAFFFILLHPVLIIWDLNRLGQSIGQTILSFTIFHFLGTFALVLMIVTILLTVYQAKIRLNYEHWKIIHKVGYLIILLGFTHSFFVGTDINSRSLPFYWWLFLGVLVLFAVCYRFIYRRILLRKSVFRIAKIMSETKDVRSIYFEKTDSGSIFNYRPGQFAFVRFFNPRLSSEEHHFTISSSPKDKYLRMTIKESGDFTRTLGNLRVGDIATIEGPFGVFSSAGLSNPLIYIAGGIGITPFISMLRHEAQEKRTKPVILFYSVKTKQDSVFYHEIEKLKKENPWFKAYYRITETEGRLTVNFLQKHANLKKSKIFICGPKPMIDALTKDLSPLIRNPNYIITEKFALK